MKANLSMERAYNLIEQFDFNDLAENDKIYVLSVMTEVEYINTRDTVKATEYLLANGSEIIPNDSLRNSVLNIIRKEKLIIKIERKSVKLYKVAAVIIILVGIFSIINYSNLHEKNNPLTFNDTIIIHKTDTVYSKLVDTVRLIKEKIVYIAREKIATPPAKLLSTAKNECDRSKGICPEDIDRILELAFNHNVSSDTLFKD